MSFLSFMSEIASNAVLSTSEQASIAASIATLQTKLSQHFGRRLNSTIRFGSSTRGTILPRSMDETSDIDYMVVFADTSLTPQTCLNRLGTFVEEHYGASTICQSSPTILLELNQVNFDLVPATIGRFGEFRIPDGGGGWMNTDPIKFDAELTAKDNAHNLLLKPAIRLLKYWNSVSEWPFESFKLEQWICGLNFSWGKNERDYFIIAIDELSIAYWQQPEWVNKEIERAKDILWRVIQHEKNRSAPSAERELAKLFRLE